MKGGHNNKHWVNQDNYQISIQIPIPHKLENLKWKYNFLDRHHIPKLNQDLMKNLNLPITPKELEGIIKIHSNNKNPRNRLFQCRILPGLQRKTNSNSPQSFPHNKYRRNIVKLLLWGYSYL